MAVLLADDGTFSVTSGMYYVLSKPKMKQECLESVLLTFVLKQNTGSDRVSGKNGQGFLFHYTGRFH